jgi:LysM repeat protein
MLQSVGSVSRTQSASPAQTSAGRDYRIKLGDTLGDIAKRNGVSVEALMEANPEISNRNRIRAGQTITIPTGGKTVIVQRGDTLGKIAAKNNTSVDALMAANTDIRNANQIYPGQVVRIAGAEARPAPKAAPRVQNTQSPVAKVPVAPNGPATPATTGIIQPGKASLKAADIAEKRASGHPSIKKCYAWVKDALLSGGATSRRLEGVPAKEAGAELKSQGFVNVLGKPGYNIKSPYDAPKGAVLVYGAAPGATDGAAKWGHIEIRTNNGFASDYASKNARTGPAANGLSGKNRVLIGVYIKPDAGVKPTQVPVAAPKPSAAVAVPRPATGPGYIVDKLGEVLAKGEGHYESYNTGTQGVKGKRVGHSYPNPAAGTVTNKTINEILATSSKSGYDSDRMFATGKYQTTIETLTAAKKAMGLTGNEKYTPEMQERVFREFLVHKAGGGKLEAFINDGKGTVETAQYAAAKEWASIAVPAGLPINGHKDKNGVYHPGPISNGRMSYYERPGQNSANMAATNELRELLTQIQKQQ